MSLTPLLFSDWWEDLDRPHRLLDQHFGLSFDPEDILDALPSTNTEIVVYRPGKRGAKRRFHPFWQSVRRGGRGASTISRDKESFQVTLDVQQFAPEEITVKVVDKNIVVEAKHEEKEDEHGWISRQFTRRYLVPNQCDIEQVESHLSSDGVLTITAPRKASLKDNSNERPIRIQYTGQPAINQVDGEANGDVPQREQAQQRNQPQRGKRNVKTT